MTSPVLARVRWAVVLALLLSVPAFADEPTVLADRWDATHVGGTKAGYVHTVIRRTAAPDGARIETTTEGRTEIARLGASVVVEERSATVEREDGTLLSIHKATRMSGTETVVDVTFRDGSATIATTALGQTREAKVPVPAGTVGPYRAERIPVEAGLKPGATHEIREFVPDLGGPVVATAKVVGPEEVAQADGTTRSLVRIDARFDVMPVVTTLWVTPDGDPVRSRVEMAGLLVETFRTTKEDALAAVKKGGAEVFKPTLIATRQLVPHPRLLDSALLRVKSRRADRPWVPVTDDRQAIERTEADGSVVLRVARVVPPPGATGKRPLADPPADLAPYLAATSMLQADDPLIRSSMQEAVAGEADAWKAAQAIERWVDRAVADKSLDVAFASALEVCRDRKGDCTEHAVLAAALCRAAGIPSRVVMGLEYLQGIFGGHAWTEVWIEGRWYAIDATLGMGWADPLHLALGRLSLSEGTYGREFATFIDSVAGLDVEVLEATFAGRSLRFDEGAVRTDGGAYVNGPWGLSVRAPAGFAVTPRGPAVGLSPELAQWARPPKEGPPRTLLALAESLGAGEDLASAAKGLAGSAALRATTVDGRPALEGDVGEGAQRRAVALVVDDVDSLFGFVLSPVETEADRALFDAFLAGVDLDAEAPVR